MPQPQPASPARPLHLTALSCALILSACAAVTPATPPPTVTLTSSAASLDASGPLRLNATVTGSASRVIFYDRGVKLGEDTTAPYEFTVNADPALNGTHAYSAQAVAGDVAGISAPVSVQIRIADTRTTELLNNGDFSQGLNPWWTAGTAATTTGGEACLNITQPGSNPWDVLFGQGGVGLNEGGTYTLSFTARAAQPTSFKTLLQFDGAPYTSYFVQDVDVTSQPKTFTSTFTMAQPGDAKAAFQFQLGAKAATTVCFSRISLTGPAFGSAVPAAGADDVNLVRLNQTGYLPDRPKLAAIPFESDRPLPWTLLDGTRAVASGVTRVFGADAASGEHLHQVDFSAVTAPADGLVLDVAGFRSHPFRIGRVYDGLKRDALAYFYHSRSGTPIEAKYVGDAWARPAGHAGSSPNQGDTRVSCFKGTDQAGNVWPGCGYELDASGGWYDAGDHGKYVVNGGVSVWTLLNLAERNARLNIPDADGSLSIPESGNGRSDLLDEVRWELDFMLRMQVPDGQTLALPRGDQRGVPLTLTPTPAGGLVHQKLTDVAWTGLPLRPDQDPQPRALYYPTTAATLNLAGVAAQCARVYRASDPAFADRCLSAARRAWQAAKAAPDVYAYDLFVGGGPYDDTDVSDEFYWAAAELYATTGEAAFLEALRASPLFLQMPEGRELVWSDLTAAGTLTLASVPTALPGADVQQARANVVAAARAFRDAAGTQGYRLPMTGATATWGSNSGVLNRSVVMGAAWDFTGDDSFVNVVLEGLNYLLGRNPMDKSYVSGYGERPLLNPHHRFWARSLDASLPGPPRGVVSGGPNSVNFSDPVAAKFKGRCVGLRCYTDDIGAYTMNEVTINWNAPLAWVAAFVEQSTRR